MVEELRDLRKTIVSDLALIQVANNYVKRNNEDLKLEIIKNECIGNRYYLLNLLDANNEKLNKINTLIAELLDNEHKKDVQKTRSILEKICGGAIDELL